MERTDLPPPQQRVVDGVPLARAPTYLRSYLDCVDGAMLLSSRRTMLKSGMVIRKTWALYRGGKMVGRVEIPLNP